MVNVTSHIFNNIFQTVHFAAVKFTMGNENMSFLLILKSQKIKKKKKTNKQKKRKQSDWTPLKEWRLTILE